VRRRPLLMYTLIGVILLALAGSAGATHSPPVSTGSTDVNPRWVEPQQHGDSMAAGRRPTPNPSKPSSGAGSSPSPSSSPDPGRSSKGDHPRPGALEHPIGKRALRPAAAMRNLNTRQVALTFDDGPDAATPQILALLRQYRIKATFCVIGVNVQAHPDMVQQIVAAGHTLCNHTWRHDLHLGDKSPDAIRADLQRTNDEIHRAAPRAPVKYFRHPGGNFTPSATDVAKSLGMTSLSWDIDPRDWDLQQYGTGAPLTAHIVNTVESQCHPGAIILSHDGGSDRSSTIAAYQTLLPWLKARYDLVPLAA